LCNGQRRGVRTILQLRLLRVHGAYVYSQGSEAQQDNHEKCRERSYDSAFSVSGPEFSEQPLA
jgi:hypothetical protein